MASSFTQFLGKIFFVLHDSKAKKKNKKKTTCNILFNPLTTICWKFDEYLVVNFGIMLYFQNIWSDWTGFFAS